MLWFKIYSIEHNETQKNLLTCQTFIIYFILLFVDFTVQPSTIFAQYSVTVEETLKPTSMLHVDTWIIYSNLYHDRDPDIWGGQEWSTS